MRRFESAWSSTAARLHESVFLETAAAFLVDGALVVLVFEQRRDALLQLSGHALQAERSSQLGLGEWAVEQGGHDALLERQAVRLRPRLGPRLGLRLGP